MRTFRFVLLAAVLLLMFAGGARGQTIFAQDTGAGTAGANLAGRTATGGGTWSAPAGDTAGAILSNAGRFYSQNSSSTYYLHSLTSTTTTYKVEADLTCFTPGGTGGSAPYFNVGILCNSTAGAILSSGGYIFWNNYLGAWTCASGAITQPGGTLTAGHVYHLTMTYGATSTVYAVSDNGGAALTNTVATTAAATPGYVGVLFNGVMSNSTGVHLSNFKATTIATSATAFTLTGPSSGAVSVASGAFTVTPNGTLTASETVTLSDGGAGGTFSTGTSFSFASGVTSGQTFTYTPSGSASGTITLTATPSPSLGTAPMASYAITVFVATNNANWYFTKNWYKSGSTYAQTNNSTAYMKFVFSGTSCSLPIDLSALSSGSINVSVSVDYSNPGSGVTLTSANTSLAVATGLASGNHYALIIVNSLPNTGPDRWGVTAALASFFKVTGMVLDSSASLQSVTPYLFTDDLWVFGDSITEFTGYSYVLAQALNAELNNVGFSAQGWTCIVGGSPLNNGYGNIPAFYSNPGGTYSSANSSWDKLDGTGHARSFATPPKYLAVNLGTNDQQFGATDAAVTASVNGWLTAIRAQCPAPFTKIFVMIPFSGYKRTAILAATLPDSSCFFIDLGAEAAIGLQNSTAPNINSADGLHPSTVRASQLGAKEAKAFQSALGGATTVSGTKRRVQ